MTEKSPKPGKVKCIKCGRFDIYDLWCPSYQRDIREPYQEINCKRFVVMK